MIVNKRGVFGVCLLAAAGAFAAASFGGGAEAAATKRLKVTVDGLKKRTDLIPEQYAFCVPAAKDHQTLGKNINPSIKWSAGPEGTKSYAIRVYDSKVPTKFDDANKEGKTISKDLKRMDFEHLILVDIPPSVSEIKEGQDSDKLTPKGKPVGPTDHGVRGANGYGSFMSGDMAGTYGGYDGPCPPWNDELMHHYIFTVYALDVASLNLKGTFMWNDARAAMKDHVLAKGSASGNFTLNPALVPKTSK
ncbi:MAG TPA: YbhB/YbcL family Raf kinase inhibitor-like protein [Candidatus Cybelea sp.]|nr:YbhB/YbcL family Raf kinase inhibitor-like protein [Candidatus Cybelea sp.]